jgi:DNA-binding transcriptional MerR regulator
MTMAKDGYVDRLTAAKMLGVTPRQLLRYVDKGWLTKYRGATTGRVRYCRREIRTINRRKHVDEIFIPVTRAS